MNVRHWSRGPLIDRKRRILIGILLVLLAIPAAGFGQVIENPAKPKAANAGRVIAPQAMLSISDEGASDFYFKWPRDLGIGADGSLLLTDADHVLQFDAAGRFLRNLFKKGQGPGEMPNPGTAIAMGRRTAVFSRRPTKFVFFDSSGTYEGEIAVSQGAVPQGRMIRLDLIGHHGGRFYLKTKEFPRTKGDPDFVDNPQTIVAVSEADGSITTLATFVTRAWVVTVGGGGGMFDVTTLIAVPFGGYRLAVAHTEEYLVKLYDPMANKVVREFRRAYQRVKGEPLTEAEKEGGIIIDNRHYSRPERKFENDVKNILCRDGEIWAVTSTRDKAKGVLIDVFDGEGVYRDYFWLKLPEPAFGSIQSPGQCALDGEFLWVVERAEDETYSIKKYRITPVGAPA